MKLKIMPLVISASFISQSVIASEQKNVSIKERLEAYRFHLQSYDTLFGQEFIRNTDSFIDFVKAQPADIKKRTLQFLSEHEASTPERILLPLAYWTHISPNKAKQQVVLKFWLQQRLQTLRDHSENPLVTDIESKKQARIILEDWAQKARTSPLEAKSNILTQPLQSLVPGIADYSLTAMGFIPGNKVEVISENKVSPEHIEWFNERVIFAGGKLDFTHDYMKMPLHQNDQGHPSFKDPIFAKIRDMIVDAKESIFIDIFLFGGTMGGTLSKFLLDQTIEKRKSNPNFKVLLMHDYATNYNMYDEMMPIFLYIKKRIDTEPELKDSFIFLQANIQRHPPGIPFGITNIVPKTKETFPALEKRSTYYESKIDHSKVIVVDANTDQPQAYFGSKNWSDHSGGYYYDDAIYVKGPAAALVQATYWYDVDAALTTDPHELPWFYYKEMGLDNRRYLPQRQAILDWFRIKKDAYPAVGSETVRIAEANVDGRIKDVRNILIDMIMKAQSHIYMEQLFLYDPYINDALMKRKAQIPNLKIKILADHNGNFKLGGLPNTLFLDQLMRHGIEVRARRTLGVTARFPNGKTQEYHQENHRKITSVDGKTLLGGSSNLNPDTLQGSFREFGAQIFSQKEIAEFEQQFLKDWSDPEAVGPVYEGNELQLEVGGKKLSPSLSRFINDLGSTVLRAKDRLERR